MGEGTVFSLSVHTSTRGGGTPYSPDGGGTPSFPTGEVPPSFLMGGTPIQSQWGYPPSQVRTRSTPSQVRMGSSPQGYPHPDLGWLMPPPPFSRMGIPHAIQVRSEVRTEMGTPIWNSIACTCYAAGGMPLAFTQEDFLVVEIIWVESVNFSHDQTLMQMCGYNCQQHCDQGYPVSILKEWSQCLTDQERIKQPRNSTRDSILQVSKLFSVELLTTDNQRSSA